MEHRGGQKAVAIKIAIFPTLIICIVLLCVWFNVDKYYPTINRAVEEILNVPEDTESYTLVETIEEQNYAFAIIVDDQKDIAMLYAKKKNSFFQKGYLIDTLISGPLSGIKSREVTNYECARYGTKKVIYDLKVADGKQVYVNGVPANSRMFTYQGKKKTYNFECWYAEVNQYDTPVVELRE